MGVVWSANSGAGSVGMEVVPSTGALKRIPDCVSGTVCGITPHMAPKESEAVPSARGQNRRDLGTCGGRPSRVPADECPNQSMGNVLVRRFL